MADGLTITAGLVSAIATTTKVARAFKPSAADSKSRAKLFQFMETVAAINAIIATLPNLPTVQNEHLQRFTKETEVEVSDIAREMEGLMKKRNNGMSSSLRMPWIRRDLDKLQKRLDWLHAKVAQEFDEVHWDIQHTRTHGPPSNADTDERLPYDSELDARDLEPLDTTEDEYELVLKELMQAKNAQTIEESFDTTTGSLLDNSSDITERATGFDSDIDNTESSLIQRRPQRPSPYRHQDVFPPVLTPTIRKARINYEVLSTRIESWLINRVIIYAIFIALILGSTATAGLSVWKAKVEPPPTQPASPYDDNFFGNISQGLGSILGVFCMIIPLIERNRLLQPEIPVWCPRAFRWLLAISTLASILSMATQCFEQAVSIMFGYGSMATQLVATMLLVIGSTEKITQRQRALDQLSTKYRVSAILQHV